MVIVQVQFQLLLFSLVLSPVLYRVARHIKGLYISPSQAHTAVITYATILLTDPRKINVVADILTHYLQAVGARINIHKSAALPIGP